MSSCFLCDCSYTFQTNRDRYSFVYEQGTISGSVTKLMKQLPIMVGSTGTGVDDQQHKNNKKQNYVSYRVKKLEFCCSYTGQPALGGSLLFPNYVLIFKVPFRETIFDYYFGVLQNFMLYSEPECVLDYKVLQPREFSGGQSGSENDSKIPRNFNININKPFVVGPNDYVGVLYMFSPQAYFDFYVNASARVWFDVA